MAIEVRVLASGFFDNQSRSGDVPRSRSEEDRRLAPTHRDLNRRVLRWYYGSGCHRDTVRGSDISVVAAPRQRRHDDAAPVYVDPAIDAEPSRGSLLVGCGVGAAATYCSESSAEDGRVGDADDDVAVDLEGDERSPLGSAGREAIGSVDTVDDPTAVAEPGQSALLAEDGVSWPIGCQHCSKRVLDRFIGVGHDAAVRL